MLVAIPSVAVASTADRDFTDFVQFGSEEELVRELESVDNLLETMKSTVSPMTALLKNRREILARNLGWFHDDENQATFN